MTVAEGYEKTSELELDDARFDQPPLVPGKSLRPYVICTTPRSGSWLLCRQLLNARIGVPSEYFNIAHANALCARWNADPRDTRVYLKALKANRTTPNGAWGAKLLWWQYANRRAALRTELLGHSRLIFLIRDDIAAQAVSQHLSHLTGVWDFTGALASVPRTDITWGDLGHLAACEREIRDQNRWWRELFASRRHEPLTIRYEDLVSDQPGIVARIAQNLGIPPSDFRIPPPEPREVSFPSEIESRRRELIGVWRKARESNAQA